MERQVFCINDSKAEMALDPISSVNAATCCREIKAHVETGRIDRTLAHDCELWHIGSFNPQTKKITEHEPVFVVALATVLEETR